MTLLSFHLVTAAITLILCVLSWFKPKPQLLNPLIIAALFSTSTGIAVSLDHPLLTVCTKLGIYTLVIASALHKLIKSKHYNPNLPINTS